MQLYGTLVLFLLCLGSRRSLVLVLACVVSMLSVVQLFQVQGNRAAGSGLGLARVV